jgi:hypothetical protein
MPKTTSNYLFELIKSLNSKERKEVLKQLGNSSASKALYLELIKTIERKKTLNTTSLKIKHLTVVKNQLQNSIEEYLAQHAHTKGFLRQGFRQFELIKQLIDRDLIHRAKNLINKLKTDAEEKEEFALLCYLHITETTHYDVLFEQSEAQSKFIANWEKAAIANKKNQYMIEMSHLNAAAISTNNFDKQKLQQLRENIENLKEKYLNYNSFKAESTRINTLMFIAEAEEDICEVQRLCIKNFQLFEENPKWKNKLPTGYASATLNLLDSFSENPHNKYFTNTLLQFDETVFNAEWHKNFRPKFLPFWHLHFLYQQNNTELKKIVEEQENLINIETDSFSKIFYCQNVLQAAKYRIIERQFDHALTNLEYILNQGINEEYPSFYLQAYTIKIILLNHTKYKNTESIVRRFQYHINTHLPSEEFYNSFTKLVLKNLKSKISLKEIFYAIEQQYPKETTQHLNYAEIDVISLLRAFAFKVPINNVMKQKIKLKFAEVQTEHH